jgi:hypothetical protein
MKTNIKFNSGTTYHRTGQIMDVLTINSINVKDTQKEDLPWLQVFNCGYRVSHENIDWNTWNGCVFVDIDSKHYYNEYKKFDADKLEDELYEYLYSQFINNFYAIQRSNSGTSYHIIFYFKVKKNELNFKKCVDYARYLCEIAFRDLGVSEIWGWKGVNDRCSISPYQGMYLTSQEIRFNNEVNGCWSMIDEWVYNEPKLVIVDKVKEHVVDFVNYTRSTSVVTTDYYEHISRMKIYTALVACHGSKEETDKAWRENIVPHLKEGNGHTRDFYVIEPDKNSWYEKYDTTFVNETWLEKFGYSFKKKFIPKKMDLYIPDILIELEENQTLADTDIPFRYDKINHLYAGCGVGKTYMSKVLGSNLDDLDFIFNGKKRVCFITPLNSISKNSFENIEGWKIIDSEHKDSFDVWSVLNGVSNICTTWESFVLYQMYNISFDYVILDEVHSFYMYDYRIDSISQIKEYFPLSHGIKIMMTGTPSFEVNEFDCYKIQIKRNDKTVRCDVVLYNDSYKGYIMEDIKSWTSDSNHLALIFKDTTNYTTEEDFKMYGLNVDIFNKSYGDNKDFILSNDNVKSQITAFSVYGQAGINLYLDKDKKARIYILSNNGLGIIQYANRIRNKEVIDKIIVPYRIDKISSDVENISDKIDYVDAKHRVEVLKSIKKDIDIFNLKTESFLKLRYGFNFDCVEWSLMTLNERNYKTYKQIKNVTEYENQLQVIYNRMIAAFFDVYFVELTEDVKFSGDTKMRSNQFAGQMVRFNGDMVKEKYGKLYLETTPEFEKIVTGNLKGEIEKVLNFIYNENGCDLERTIDVFKKYIQNIIKGNKTIKKVDINRIGLYYDLKSKWNTYYNSAFLTLMLNDKWDDIQIAAVYMRTIWNNTMMNEDWKKLAEESYQKLSNIRKVVKENKSIFVELEKMDPSEPINFENDDMVGKIYGYLKQKHTRGTGTGRKKKIFVKGMEFGSVQDAAKYFNVRRETITRWVKTGI